MVALADQLNDALGIAAHEHAHEPAVARDEADPRIAFDPVERRRIAVKRGFDDLLVRAQLFDLSLQDELGIVHDGDAFGGTFDLPDLVR